jgi:hypothetical protein
MSNLEEYLNILDELTNKSQELEELIKKLNGFVIEVEVEGLNKVNTTNTY